MYNKIYIGIDVGAKGYISLCDNGNWSFYAIPKIKNEIDYHALNKIFKDIALLGNVFCVIEHIHALFNSAASATFSFGEINGFLKAMLYAHNIPHIYVQPKVWQKEMWKGVNIISNPKQTFRKGLPCVRNEVDTKGTSLLAVKMLFPTLDFRRTEKCKNTDDNKVDSILMCEYGRRMNY